MQEQSEQFYDDLNYANSRMVGTVMKTKSNIPIYVEEVNFSDEDIGTIMAYVRYMDTDKWGKLPLSKISFQPIQLGYVNTKFGAEYLRRKPMRQDWRQGIRNNTVVSSLGLGIKKLGKELKNLINDKYPSYEDCFRVIHFTDVWSSAFHKHFCLKLYMGSYKVCYKGVEVGEVDTSTLEVDLKRKYIYLSEKLKEIIDGQN